MSRMICQLVRRSLRTRLLVQGLEERATPATFNVTNANDSGLGSLRQAILSANATSGIDDIVFDPTFFATAQNIYLSSPLADLSEGVNIKGTIASNCNIVRLGIASPFRIFNFNMSGVGNVTMSNITIWNGNVSGQGGGIYMADDNLTLTNCVLKNNTASASGGGIALAAGTTGQLKVTGSTISGNVSGLRGGGIYFNTTGILDMVTSTVSGNIANGGGGGIYFFSNSAILFDSTISGNQASNGGGILCQSNAFVSLSNNTIAFNTASNSGGGISNATGTCFIDNNVVAKNVAVSGTGDDIIGPLSSAKNNLVGETDGSTGITDPSNKTGTKAAPLDAKLGPLASNGGPTNTHLPAGDSPVVDAGGSPGSQTTDQRGMPRVMGAAMDIGAVETFNLAVLNNSDGGPGSLRQVIANSNSIAGANTITFDPTYFATAKTISMGGTEMLISDSVTITGPTAPLTINANNASRIFNVNIPSLSLQPVSLSSLIMTQGNAVSGNLGGAIQNGDDIVTLSNCVFTNNSALVGGAAVWTSGGGYVSAIGCTFSGNNSGFGGGAIGFSANGGSLALQSSTMSGNSCSNGGAIYFRGPVGAFGCSVVNSTISGNVANGSGGAVYFAVFSGAAKFSNSTIVNNSAVNFGGGIRVDSFSSGTISFESSIVANNMNANAPDISSAGTVNVNHSAISSATGFTATGVNNVPYGTDLKLSPLADNGGPTQTVALLFGSPCINAGSNILALPYDQRGLARTQFGTADIGAFESQTNSVTTWAGADPANPTSWESPLNWSNGVPGKLDAAKLAGSAALEIKAAESIGGLEIPSTWTGSLNIFAPLTLNQSSTVRAGAINVQSGGAVSILGSLNFANPNAVTVGGIGTWTNSGTIVHSGAGNVNLSGNAVIETLAGALFDIQSTGGVSGTGGMINRGTLRKSASTSTTSITSNFANIGGSINVQTGALSLQAALDLNQGILSGFGTMLGQVANLNGSVRPGNSPGKLTINGGYTQSGTGELQVELNGTTVGVTYDQLAVVGSVTLGGTLTPLLGFSPQVNDTFIIVDNDGTSDAVTGTFTGMPEGSTFAVGSKLAQITYKGGDGNDVALKIVTAPLPQITSVQVNDGSAQRSRVASLLVTFNQIVSLPAIPANAFQLKRQSDNASVTLAASVTNVGHTEVTLTFTGGAVNSSSLADGRYTLTALATQIAGGTFDGDGNGTGGDNYVLVGNTTNKLFRLFGDADGNGLVDGVDFGAFRSAFNTTSNIFDFDGSGVVDGTDFGQFRQRFGLTI